MKVNRRKQIALKYLCLSQVEKEYVHAHLDPTMVQRFLDKQLSGSDLGRFPRPLICAVLRDIEPNASVISSNKENKVWRDLINALQMYERPPIALVEFLRTEIS